MIYQMYLVKYPRGPKKFKHTNILKMEQQTRNLISDSGSQVVLIELSDQDFTVTIVTHASTPWIQSQLISGERHNLFKITYFW